MKNKLKEIVLEEWDEGINGYFRTRAVLHRDRDIVKIITDEWNRGDGQWHLCEDLEEIKLEYCEKIIQAWGKKKEVTEKEIQKLLEDLSDFDWCGVEDEPYIQEHLVVWLSKLGIEVKPEKTREDNDG